MKVMPNIKITNTSLAYVYCHVIVNRHGSYIVVCLTVAAKPCLPHRYLTTAACSRFTIPAFSRHITICIIIIIYFSHAVRTGYHVTLLFSVDTTMVGCLRNYVPPEPTLLH
jgi:hypothetical protein